VAHVNSAKDFGAMGGTVQFRSGGTTLGTGTVGTDGNVSCACDTTAFASAGGAVGAHQVFARYLGNGNYASGDSGTKTLTVTSANTTVVQVVPATPQLGATTTLTATVTSTGNYGNFSGTVDFKDGGTVIATDTVSNSGAASAVIDWTKLPGTKVGAHTIIATYSGGGNYGGQDSTGATMTVSGAAVTLILSADKSAATAGETVTFTASASGNFGVPGGLVTLKDAGGATVGTPAAPDAGTGIVTFAVTSLVAGPNALTASIAANGNYAAKTSNTVNVSIQSSTVTVVTPPTGTLKVGASLAFPVTVSCPSCGSGPNPTGTVRLFESGNTTALDTDTLSGGSKTLHASFSGAPGTHTVFARYGGSSSLAASDSLPITITVQADTTTTLAAVTTPIVAGLNQTFTATVTAGATGSVAFKDGGTTIGSGTLSGGTASFSTTALTAGNHSITAVYGGDTLYLTSTSTPAQSVTVVAKAPTTLVVTAPATAVHDTSVTFTAQVTCSSACTGAGAFSGTVTFTDGATTLGTGTVQADGSASLVLAAGITATGNHTVKASYAGGGNYAASADNTGDTINIT
jgi:hypothetical protein